MVQRGAVRGVPLLRFRRGSFWFETFDQQTPSPLSRGEYGGRVGGYKVHDLMTRHKIPCTYFIPAWVAMNYPKECQMVARPGHEIGYHGFYHESAKNLCIERERDLMKRGMATLKEVTGTKFGARCSRGPTRRAASSC